MTLPVELTIMCAQCGELLVQGNSPWAFFGICMDCAEKAAAKKETDE